MTTVPEQRGRSYRAEVAMVTPDLVTTGPRPTCSVIVPCYNEEDGVVRTVEDLRSVLAPLGDCEIIVVNDGSTDDTSERLARLQQADEPIVVIEHARNRGYGAALKSGIRAARSDLIVITDADGTYPNERIPDLLSEAVKSDMVVGARTGTNVRYPRNRKLAKAMLIWYASWMAGQYIPDINSGLRVFHKSVVSRFIRVLPNGFSFTTTITLALLTNSYRVSYIPIDYAERVGRSKIRPIRDTLKFLQLILRTAVYFAPLRAFAPIVGLLSVAFVVSAGYDIVVARNLTDKTVILLMFVLNTAMFALLADMIDKRSD